MPERREKFYVTTPIYYVNDRPHIGHAYATIAADVIARYWRQKIGSDHVWFLVGTDEHGAKIERAAEKAGKSPQEFTNEIAGAFRETWIDLGVSFDDFIRTTEPRHERVVALFAELLKNAKTPFAEPAIYAGDYEGLYCTGHEAFLTESDLVDGLCPDHKTKPERIREKNWFFRLSAYRDFLLEQIESAALVISPDARRNEVLAFLKGGLEDIAISRPQVHWGIPVPFDSEQTVYVWVDALLNYISAVGYGDDETRFRKWWPADLHIIGKDIIKFHCILWPALLAAVGLPIPRQVFAHGFFTINGEKISKSLGNAIDPRELRKKYGLDPFRYYLFREIAFGGDGDFSEARLREVYNGELANGIGNFVARVGALGLRISPVMFLPSRDFEPSLRDEVKGIEKRYHAAFAEYQLHNALAEAFRLVGVGDRYLNLNTPWAAKDDQALRTAIGNAAAIVETLARLLMPFLPGTAENIRRQIYHVDGQYKFERGGNIFPRLS